MLRAHRAIEVGDLDEMTEVLARAAQGERWPRGRRLAVMTASGGQAELILDLGARGRSPAAAALAGVARRRWSAWSAPITGDGNPLDAWGNGDYATNFPHALARRSARDPGYDVVAFCSDSFDDQPMGRAARALELRPAASPRPRRSSRSRSTS